MMGTTYRFLATTTEAATVLDWFRSQPEHSVEVKRDGGSLFLYGEVDGSDPDPKNLPLVNVFLPMRLRGILTTIGEVHFLPTPISTFPVLKGLNKHFRRWLSNHPCVYSHRPAFVHEWDYFLEGSTQNYDSDIFALPEGMAALKSGSYFVSSDERGRTLDLVWRKLELRGVAGIEPN